MPGNAYFTQRWGVGANSMSPNYFVSFASIVCVGSIEISAA